MKIYSVDRNGEENEWATDRPDKQIGHRWVITAAFNQ